MFTQTVTVKEKDTQNIIIGRRGTYGTEEIVFDLSWLVDVYGNGSAVLMVKRPVDETAYPAVTARNGNNLIWTVGDVDTSYKGHGECELFWYVDESLAKSVIYSIAILRDIGETEEAPPDPYETWIDDLTELGAETLENARQAAQSAAYAAQSAVDAETAQGKAETAQEKAETAQDKAETAQEKAEDAQEEAEAAVEHYPKIVDGYWYVWQNGAWVNTGVKAEGVDGREIVSVSCEKTGTSGLVDTYTMTITYNSGNPDTVQFLVTNGEDGYNPVVTITTITGGHRVTITDKTHPDGQSFDVTDGIDGVSPEVTITEITGGHRVTITDEDHPLGQSFDVMDGTNTDAEHVTYDDTASYSDGTVGKALSQLNSEITDLTINKADVIVSSASGAIASFSDGMAAPIKSMVVDIDPIQDLHGQDAPYPPGGGNNKLNLATDVTVLSGSVPSAVTITSADGTATITEAYYNRDANKFGWAFNVEENQTYTISGDYQSTSNATIKIYSSDGSLVATETLFSFGAFSRSFNSGSNTVLYFYATITSWGQTITFTKTQIEKGSTATPWKPYSNLCPISGHTECDIWDDPIHGGTIIWNQILENGNFASATGWSSVRGTGSVNNNEYSYTVSELGGGGLQNRTYHSISIPKNDKVLVSLEYYASKSFDVRIGLGGTSSREFTLSEGVTVNTWNKLATICRNDLADTTDLRIGSRSVVGGMAVGDTYKFRNVQIFNLTQMFGTGNEPSTVEEFRALFPKDYYAYTATPVETCVSAVNGDPYRHYPIDWSDEAGTVYSGSLTVNEDGSGVLTSESAIEPLPTSSSPWYSGYGGYYYTGSGNFNVTDDNRSMVKCSAFKPIQDRSTMGLFATGPSLYFARVDTLYPTLTDWLNYLSNNSVQVLVPLATPVTIPLTAEQVGQIMTLYGQNNIFSDVGDVTVNYRCDTAKYIDKKLAALVAALS